MVTLENFASVYDEYSNKIYKFFYYRTFHRETAEDLTSHTFTKALENCAKFDAAKGTVSAWLYTIANHTLIDHYRQTKHHEDLDAHEDLATNEDLKKETDHKLLLAKVEKYLAQLSDEQRMIVLLRVWDGLAYREIAQIIGKSETNCKMIFCRTIQKIQHSLNLTTLLIFSLLSSLHTL